MGVFLRKDRQKGQILLIVVLAAVVSLTVGLSAVSRSITNTRVSTEETNSQKALSAAEAGVEKSLNTAIPAAINGTLSNNSAYDTKATAVSGSHPLINNGNTVLQDDGTDIWLSQYPDFSTPQWSGTLNVYWNDTPGSGSCTLDPAIEVALISGNTKTAPNMTRVAYDACPSRKGSNHFLSPGGGATINGTAYSHSLALVVTNGFIARIIPLYADAEIAVQGNGLPPQGYNISSEGSSSDTTRKIQVYQGFPRLPIEFFPYNLFLP